MSGRFEGIFDVVVEDEALCLDVLAGEGEFESDRMTSERLCACQLQ